MKLFECQVCGQTLYFENTRCESCGHRLGYVAEEQELFAVERTGGRDSFAWQIAGKPDRGFRLCKNAEYDVCNWLVPAGQHDLFCRACRHNHLVPDLAKPSNRDLWRLMEIAKHRLVYALIELRLPLVTRAEDSREGLMFDFLEDPAVGRKVMTGHDLGNITIGIAEADDAERERRRKSMHEPYRTLLGHFRHEIGHYYWDRLVRNAPAIDAFRRMFGDEREDYNAAVQRHYNEGAPSNWRERYVSAYATSHPWEDFAETFAHYLHIVDTLETAEAFGVTVHPKAISQADALSAEVDFQPYFTQSIEPLVNVWVPLTFALNSLNRSMGLGDLYPFILPPAVIEKLGFIHDLVRGKAEDPRSKQAFGERLAPVPTNVSSQPSPLLPSL